MAVRARWGTVATLLVVALLGGSALAGSGTTSGDVPARRTQQTALVRTSTADALVQVNVDIGMRVQAGKSCRSAYTGACKGAVYHPCFNLDDPSYAGCEMYTHYRVIPPGFDLSQGISIVSSAGRLTHSWGRKITEAHLEVYAVDPARRYGSVRIRVNSFPHVLPVGDTAYSDEIGHINLPLLGAPGTGWISGTAVGADGRPMPPRSFKFDVFGRTDTGRHTGVAGEGAFMEYGFGSARVEDGVRDGSFMTRPLYVGTYDVHVQRKGASYTCRLKVKGPFRFDLDFGKDKLGHPGCEPLRPLARTVPG
ncbi:MAG: hypothetical protein QOE05_1850 [Actinomycetota bacterium]|nr:hypothetical protein [Actinomycetota bacterium]